MGLHQHKIKLSQEKQKLERKIMPKEKNDKLSERDKRSLELRAQLIAEGLLRPMTPKIAITPKPIQKKFIPHSRCKKKSVQQKPTRNTKSTKREPPPIVCVLCGEKVKRGHMVEHKKNVHGQDIYKSTCSSLNGGKNVWVHLVQGGLPSLGKRSR